MFAGPDDQAPDSCPTVRALDETADEMAALQDQIDAALDREARRIAEQGGLLVIHDLSAIQSYDSDARVHWAERIKRRPSGFARAVIARVPATPLIRMAAAGLRLLGTMHVTMKVRIVDDLEPVLREYGVQVPAPLST